MRRTFVPSVDVAADENIGTPGASGFSGLSGANIQTSSGIVSWSVTVSIRQ